MKCQNCKRRWLDTHTHCPECEIPLVDNVNSPSHYKQGKYEVLDVIMDFVKQLPGQQGFLAGNIIKYIARYFFKNGAEDLKKARKYLDELIKVVDRE